jgi:hypothetical protein
MILNKNSEYGKKSYPYVDMNDSEEDEALEIDNLEL